MHLPEFGQKSGRNVQEAYYVYNIRHLYIFIYLLVSLANLISLIHGHGLFKIICGFLLLYPMYVQPNAL